MTVAPPKLAEGSSVILSSHCNEAMQNQYNGKQAEVGKADGLLKSVVETGEGMHLYFSFHLSLHGLEVNFFMFSLTERKKC